MTDFRMACYTYDQVYGDLLTSFIHEHLSEMKPLKDNNVKNPLSTWTQVDVPQEPANTLYQKDTKNT